MKNKVFLLNGEKEIPLDQWKLLIENSPVASFFQTPECYQFYASLTFLKPFLYGVAEDGKLKGIACGYVQAEGRKLKQFFSRRAIIPGGILLDKDIEPDSITALLEFLKKELCKKAIYIECRNFNDYSEHRPYFEKVGFVYQPHLNFHVPTPNVEQCYKQLNSTKRRDIKLSLKEGVEIVETKSENDIKNFYTLLSNLYQKKIKTPLFPYEFFEKLTNQPFGHLFVVKYGSKIIGGNMSVSLKNKVLYEWFVCGLDGEYKKFFPSTLATWSVIQFAAENGFEYFDMMGAGKPDESYGVREFKAKFGGNLVEHGRFEMIFNKYLYHIGIIGVKFLKHRK
ncbi:MAG TPA: peptidoglycan bridge formation glycyltransferase FemA/FemB family protein [Paludibacteraceae bacterium]|nr:peptidoglycan bridge formation glycyltransferase FemA/FemB family protein [Paludibacteraceae bacterium]HOV83192.1 peptidoglycan bridge formation glycyltransferase FemA/FemB family protein [Paludibacteraceae bacterium]